MNACLKFVLILLFIVIVPICHADTDINTVKHSDMPVLQSQIEGEWKVFKVPSLSSVEKKITHVDPIPEMGKTIKFNKGKFSHEKHFLFLDDHCAQGRYKISRKKIESDGIDPKGSLNAWGPAIGEGRSEYGPLREDMETTVDLYCDGKFTTKFDVSKGGFLAIYWDEGFYYLKKVSPNKNKQ